MLFCTIVNHSIDKNIQKIHVDFFNNYYDLVVSALAAVRRVSCICNTGGILHHFSLKT